VSSPAGGRGEAPATAGRRDSVPALSVALRPARVDDLAFLERLHAAAMRPHVEATFGPWNAEEQSRRFRASTDPTNHEIVSLDGAPVGCQWVRAHADSLELVRLYLLPAVQRRGIGGDLVARLCARADRAGLPLRLRVLKVNPAQRLYARHGFRITGETETHLAMERPTPRP